MSTPMTRPRSMALQSEAWSTSEPPWAMPVSHDHIGLDAVDDLLDAEHVLGHLDQGPGPSR